VRGGPTFDAETDRLTGTRLWDGNTVTLFPTGVSSYAKRWELIEGATSTIHLVSFSFMSDDTTRRLATTVADKVRQGVEVVMIVDDGALYTTRSRGILRTMTRAGAEVLTYNNPLRYVGVRRPVRRGKLAVKRRFHEKYMVVDGRQAVLGGMNWGTKYALGGTDPKWWRDTDVHLTGPVVADIQRRFLEDVFVYRALPKEQRQLVPTSLAAEPWVAAARAEAEAYMAEHHDRYFPDLPATGEERIRYVGHKPWDEERLPLTDAMLQLIVAAEREIYWGCHGVRPPRVFAEQLAAAAARGVDVHLITNSKTSSRSLMGRGLLGWMYWESSNHFRWLLERGVHVHEWQLPGAFHSKNLVVDETVAAVGSYNLASGSAFHHTESAVFVHGGDFPGQVRAQFDADLADCRPVTLERARRPLRWFDPMRRTLHERNRLVDPSLLPPAVAADLDAGRLVWKYADPPPPSPS
jgi:phosphatidylserine/phosphatidylglycerophosphate/cardiolipin synthase-like enzyme